MNMPIYLDHHATTPIDPAVLEAMLPYFKEQFGNPSSIDHRYGNQALQAVEAAREAIARLIKAEPEEIIFTSGATEADNLALFGVVEAGQHVITCTVEHKAVLDPCKHLKAVGCAVSYLEVNQNGEIDLGALEEAITDKTALISVMAANNEIGTVSPLKEIGSIAALRGVLFHTDAAQAFGHIPLDVKEMNINLMSLSGHKIYGPKGIGALYVRRGMKLKPLLYGGGHERGIRSGTLNVPGIVGLGKAAEIADMKDEHRIAKLTKRLYEGISKQVAVEVNGNAKHKLAHNLNVYFEGVEAKALINEVKDEIAISAGSACTTNDVRPSHVLKAIGCSDERAYSSIRFGLGRYTTEEEIDKTIEVITKTVIKLRSL